MVRSTSGPLPAMWHHCVMMSAGGVAAAGLSWMFPCTHVFTRKANPHIRHMKKQGPVDAEAHTQALAVDGSPSMHMWL